MLVPVVCQMHGDSENVAVPVPVAVIAVFVVLVILLVVGIGIIFFIRKRLKSRAAIKSVKSKYACYIYTVYVDTYMICSITAGT